MTPICALDAGDQTSGMSEGYLSAAERIEIEVGAIAGLCLDIGCNVGVGMAALAKRWPESAWFGIEPSPVQAALARDRGLKVVICACESIWLPDRSFDFAFARHSLEHCRDRAGAIAQVLRVLKRGGLFYIQAPIEPGGTQNSLHLSPFVSHAELRAAFGLPSDPSAWTERYWGPQDTVAELILEKT